MMRCGFLADFDRIAQQRALGIERAQGEIILRHVGLQRQQRAAISGGQRVGIMLECPVIIAHLPEQVGLVGRGALRRIERIRLERVPAAGRTRPADAPAGLVRSGIAADIDIGQEARLIGVGAVAARFFDAGGGGFQILVGVGRLFFQFVQLLIAKHFPPVPRSSFSSASAVSSHAFSSCAVPLPLLFLIGGRRHVRQFEIRREAAGGEHGCHAGASTCLREGEPRHSGEAIQPNDCAPIPPQRQPDDVREMTEFTHVPS